MASRRVYYNLSLDSQMSNLTSLIQYVNKIELFQLLGITSDA